jgi:segregation and condensation protein A
MYQVTIENFSGPLEKLLELIEAKKLDITRISLAEVTGDFLAYVQALRERMEGPDTESEQPGDDEAVEQADAVAAAERARASRLVADFLVVAAQLILIKSKALLPDLAPTAEEEESMYDLERRLKIYSELKPMFASMKKAWAGASHSYSRELMRDIAPIFYPPSSATPDSMHESFKQLIQSLGSLVVEQKNVQRQIITLEGKISELSSRIASGISRFSAVIHEKSKEESIVLFLALLHLLRDRLLSVSQASVFGDITMEQREGELN